MLIVVRYSGRTIVSWLNTAAVIGVVIIAIAVVIVRLTGNTAAVVVIVISVVEISVVAIITVYYAAGPSGVASVERGSIGTENLQLVVLYPACAGSVAIGYSHRSYAAAGITLHFPYVRSSGYSAITIVIVDNGSVIDDGGVPAVVNIVIVDLPAADISPGNEGPVGSRHIVG